MTDDVRFDRGVRPDIAALGQLFEAAWGNPKTGYERVFDHSFTWVSAHAGDDLVGFANVAWDGDVHFFLLDTTVHPDWQRRGIGSRLVREAIDACRGHGEWLHVDADDALMNGLYLPAGFRPTPAGLVDLTRAEQGTERKETRVAEVTGTFTVGGRAGEESLSESGGVRLTHAFGDQEFEGGIVGVGHVDWLMCYRSNRTAEFVGLQRIDATLDGRTGGFVLRSIGAHDGAASKGSWSIVGGSGSDGLEGIVGEGDWTAGPGPNGTYRLRYSLG